MSLIYAVCDIPTCKYMYNFSNLHYHTAFFLHAQHVYSSAFCRYIPITRPFGPHHDIQKVWFFILFIGGGYAGFYLRVLTLRASGRPSSPFTTS